LTGCATTDGLKSLNDGLSSVNGAMSSLHDNVSGYGNATAASLADLRADEKKNVVQAKKKWSGKTLLFTGTITDIKSESGKLDLDTLKTKRDEYSIVFSDSKAPDCSAIVNLPDRMASAKLAESLELGSKVQVIAKITKDTFDSQTNSGMEMLNELCNFHLGEGRVTKL
jgi:hypothetical protein